MTKKNKVDLAIGIGLGLITTIVITYLGIRFFTYKQNDKQLLSSTKKSVGCNTTGNNHSADFPLKKESTGLEVKNLQKWLNQKGEKLCVDGTWGDKTEIAYQKYKDQFFWGSNEIGVMSFNSNI